ncbi:DUF3857 domain-containing protein [Limibacter armeniacum]|uniref:DUF3857 domain-containing protein n=1 Tax=Limibacter armeniacum TaxID=466084 RepID=UPI002FE5E508
MKKLLTALLLLMTIVPVMAKNKVKWGKVSQEEWQMTQCEYEPEAKAVVLSKIGKMSLRGGKVYYDIHVRTKILSDDATDLGNVNIPFYSGNNTEKVSSVKAHTLIMENGKEQEFEVDDRDMYKNEVSKNRSEVRFAFTNVKKGAILEYKYTLSSESLFILDDWRFQNDIPTLFSSIDVLIPTDVFKYKILYQGYRLALKYMNDQQSVHWELENLPSIKDIPSLYCMEDYVEKLKFQLLGYYQRDAMGAVIYKELLSTWDATAAEFRTDSDIERYMGRKGIYKDIIAQVIKDGDSDLIKAVKLHEWVVRNLKWNKYWGIVPSKSPAELYESGLGNSAELNAFLTGLFKTAELKAEPALSSTRSNGVIATATPMLTEFNTLGCLINIEGKSMLVDATDRMLPITLLPAQLLNTQVFAYDRERISWLFSETSEKTGVMTNVIIDLTGEKPSGEMHMRFTGYEAKDMREKLLSEDEEMESFVLAPEYMQVAEEEWKNQENVYEPLEYTVKMEGVKSLTENTDRIYMPSLFKALLQENPFKDEERLFPVQFRSEYQERYMMQVKLPEGYRVEELPEGKKVNLPGNAGSFVSQMQQMGQVLMVRFTFKLNKTFLPADHYLAMKHFFDLMMEHGDQKIVLVKNEG